MSTNKILYEALKYIKENLTVSRMKLHWLLMQPEKILSSLFVKENNIKLLIFMQHLAEITDDPDPCSFLKSNN